MTTCNFIAPTTRPAWTTRHSELDGTYLERLVPVAVLRQEGASFATEGGTARNLGFEVTYNETVGERLESDELPGTWLSFADPDSARTFARALLAAAEDWERLTCDSQPHRNGRAA
ncbi:hypothetical protein ON058_00475 [Demequina sp. B12]|uniref:hypothetical protein n=1 Tax=Demequina sp. B12 TaxID=2992757 RepID=UPI00237BA285|nr:hypothetical protein [Demequina sp. B12]MDE0571889.1 hypothetical protein [Demequina sp. B12]